MTLMKSQICQVADLVSPDAKDLGIEMPEELTIWDLVDVSFQKLPRLQYSHDFNGRI